eukprot:1137030-Pelagomonas_calceolata.AAC.3
MEACVQPKKKVLEGMSKCCIPSILYAAHKVGRDAGNAAMEAPSCACMEAAYTDVQIEGRAQGVTRTIPAGPAQACMNRGANASRAQAVTRTTLAGPTRACCPKPSR